LWQLLRGDEGGEEAEFSLRQRPSLFDHSIHEVLHFFMPGSSTALRCYKLRTSQLGARIGLSRCGPESLRRSLGTHLRLASIVLWAKGIEKRPPILPVARQIGRIESALPILRTVHWMIDAGTSDLAFPGDPVPWRLECAGAAKPNEDAELIVCRFAPSLMRLTQYEAARPIWMAGLHLNKGDILRGFVPDKDVVVREILRKRYSRDATLSQLSAYI
jgi:hypothetical protein